jgi:hypothetical protein
MRTDGATVKAFGRSDDQLERKGLQRTHAGMGRQAPRHRSPLDLFFQGSSQLLDLRRQLVE